MYFKKTYAKTIFMAILRWAILDIVMVFSWGDTDPRVEILLTSTPDSVPSLFYIFRSKTDRCT